MKDMSRRSLAQGSLGAAAALLTVGSATEVTAAQPNMKDALRAPSMVTKRGMASGKLIELVPKSATPLCPESCPFWIVMRFPKVPSS